MFICPPAAEPLVIDQTSNTPSPSEWIMSCKRLSESLVLVMLCFNSLYKAGDCPLLTLGNPSYVDRESQVATSI